MAHSKSGYLDDQESLEELVLKMPPELQAEYRSYGHLEVEAAFRGRVMVVYVASAAGPTRVELLRFGDIAVSRDGPVVESRIGSHNVSVSPVASKLPGYDLFIQVPQHFVFRWRGKRNSAGALQFIAHYAVLVKSRSKSLRQTEGHTYCETLNKFRERFPEYDIAY